MHDVKKIIQMFRRWVSSFIMFVCRVFPINEKKIVLSSFFSTAISDNPYEIFIAMREMYSDYRYIWLLRNPVEQEGIETVRAGTILSIYHLATAKCWIDNSRKRSWVIKRKGQYYVQTWHANICFKHVEADAADRLPALYVKSAKRDSRMADLFLSGSNWLTESYRNSFWYSGPILELGLPRSDVFYKDSSDIRKKVDAYFEGNSKVHYVLYSPTFRQNDELDPYIDDCERVLNALRNRFSGEWKFLMRLHPRIADKNGLITYTDNVLDASRYPNINELIVRSDIMITDYSSCMFDAMEAGKTVLLYATDVVDYMADRGGEFLFEELPFPLTENLDDLCYVIMHMDEEEWKLRSKEFMKRLGIYNGSDSSKKVAEYIIEHM